MPATPRRNAVPAQAPQAGRRVALVLQGGGALGAYHLGAFQALATHGYQPDWVAGISIGAFNAAIIAGNDPEDRLDRLTAFWGAISWPDVPFGNLLPLRLLHNQLSNAEALAIGQPNFFSPRAVSPYFSGDAAATELSFYDTSPMLGTLPKYTSFDRINAGATRLTLGATNLGTGELEWFDNTSPAPPKPLTPAHVVASGSLPPGFPATEIEGQFYWDGGCVSNTPLEAIAAGQGEEHLLVFVIDLWSLTAKPPSTMNGVFWRAKQIQYASRIKRDVQVVKTAANHAHALNIGKAAGLPQMTGLPPAPALQTGRLDIVHITYQPGADQIPNSDAEFSRTSIAERRAAGLRDMEAALNAAPWTQPPPPHERARVHSF
jgi:NTE family protein